MREQEPVTQVPTSSEAQDGWPQLLDRVNRGGTRVIVEKSGIPVAAVISPEDMERLSELDAVEEAGWGAVDRIRARQADAAPDDVLVDITAEVEAVRRERNERTQTGKSGR